jgi:hypothetical protein
VLIFLHVRVVVGSWVSRALRPHGHV